MEVPEERRIYYVFLWRSLRKKERLWIYVEAPEERKERSWIPVEAPEERDLDPGFSRAS